MKIGIHNSENGSRTYSQRVLCIVTNWESGHEDELRVISLAATATTL